MLARRVSGAGSSPSGASELNIQLIDRFFKAAAESRRPIVALLAEALWLRLSPSHLGFSEYLNFKLYRDDLDSKSKKQYVGGLSASALKDIVSDERARYILRDKLTTYTLLQGYGFPTPTTKLVYRSLRPSAVACLRDAGELANYLRDPANLPVYLKPSWGSKGIDNRLLLSCDGDRLRLGTGDIVDLGEFVRSLDDGRTLGWLLQEPLRAHPRLQWLTGTDRISSVRLCTVHDGHAVHVFKAILKVNRGDSDNDDFWDGALGNAVAAVDVGSGRLIRAVSGAPDQETLNPQHPRTGHPIVGFEIPCWDELVRLAVDAHRALPTMVCPHWDIAVTDRGPVILEINSFGSVSFLQRAYREGFANDRLLEILRHRAASGMLDPDMFRMDPLKWHRKHGLLRRYWMWRHAIARRHYRLPAADSR
jgi:hypothetical protein